MEVFNKALIHVNSLTETFPSGFIDYYLNTNNGKPTLQCTIKFMVSRDNFSDSNNTELVVRAEKDIEKLKKMFPVDKFKFLVRKGRLKFIEGIFAITI